MTSRRDLHWPPGGRHTGAASCGQCASTGGAAQPEAGVTPGSLPPPLHTKDAPPAAQGRSPRGPPDCELCRRGRGASLSAPASSTLERLHSSFSRAPQVDKLTRLPFFWPEMWTPSALPLLPWAKYRIPGAGSCLGELFPWAPPWGRRLA